jgi:threonine synthase
MTLPILNPALMHFECIGCAAILPIADYPTGCPHCLARGEPASIVPRYGNLPPLANAAIGRSRFAARLPYAGGPTLGEGSTPVVDVPRLADALGLDSLAIKLEGANPTGSHKDRMSAQFIARALAAGRNVVAAASSGNAGASVAAYAAAAGIACVIVTTPATAGPWKRAIQRAGARLEFVDDAKARWALIRDKSETEGWFSATNLIDPPVGSEPFAVDGYKTLGYELALDPLSREADAIIVPTARGDLLWGIFRAFEELLAEGFWTRMPRLIAVEPFPRIERVLAGEERRQTFPGSSPMTSINGGTVTLQAIEALRRSGGFAVSVDGDAAQTDQAVLGRHGFDFELSAAAALSGLRVAHRLDPSLNRAVLVSTSHGYKESGTEQGAK